MMKTKNDLINNNDNYDNDIDNNNNLNIDKICTRIGILILSTCLEYFTHFRSVAYAF